MTPSPNFEWPSYTQTVHRSVYPAIDPSNPSNSASGKVVVVTGRGSGVGKGIAQAYVKAGAKAVIILGRRENILSEAKKDLEKPSPSTKILTFKADIVDAKALENAFATTEKEVGPIDITVANAGYLPSPGSLTDENLDFEEYMKSFDINIKGTINTFRSFMKHKSSKGEPTFIALNTGAAHVPPFPNGSSYAASKAAQAQVISAFQTENPDVRVVQFHPGVIETEMFRKSGMQLTLDDVSLPASFAVWLASPAASWVKGLFLWAHWDVEELEKLKEEILAKGHLKLTLGGFPQVEKPVVVV
ncbi:Short chain dehydrogenase citE [Pseudocercospora fuligena]|uniref:Short chain dehydrogenase citE n=1 Tax=Pseudocercospora fuligena TaxID=685502 RepID=A0A8H6RFQ9_9PEZI|nr:Short chain dehydrogenase citE [Pseudocercospora fuligena]